jgi:hypothetical protein
MIVKNDVTRDSSEDFGGNQQSTLAFCKSGCVGNPRLYCEALGVFFSIFGERFLYKGW